MVLCIFLPHFGNKYLELFLSNTVRSRRLSFFGHLHCADPSQDHAVLYKPVLWVLLMIGDGGLAVPDNPG